MSKQTSFSRVRAWLELARVSNLPTVWTNVVAAWVLAGGGLGDARLLWLLPGAALFYCAGMILNDAADARHDAAHRQERPLPSGRVSRVAAWLAGGGCLVGGVLFFVIGAGAALWWTLALAAAILFYDAYHKPWAGSVLVMGACRTLLYLAAASVLVDDVVSQPLLVLFALALGFYIVGLTLIARAEARGGFGSRWVAILAMLALFAPALAAMASVFINQAADPLWRLGDMRPLAAWLLVPVFVIWVVNALKVMRGGGPHIGRAVGLLLAGIAVVDGVAVATVSLPLGCAFVALAPLLRLWQRWIAAT